MLVYNILFIIKNSLKITFNFFVQRALICAFARREKDHRHQVLLAYNAKVIFNVIFPVKTIFVS